MIIINNTSVTIRPLGRSIYCFCYNFVNDEYFTIFLCYILHVSDVCLMCVELIKMDCFVKTNKITLNEQRELRL